MIELKGITKSFKRDFYSKKFKALDEVSFKVNPGDLVGFLGANGAGKTTSLKIILDFIKADQGSVTYSSQVGSTFQGLLKNLGYLPERPYFHTSLTGREFIKYMAQLHNVHKVDIENRMIYWSERLGIDHALDRKLFNYSKGMLQRVGFVACLIHEPSFLIMDEPVSGLDPVGRKELKDVIVELHQKGKTIFFSSHIVSDIEEICHSLIVLDKGKLIYDGKVYDLLEKETSGLCEIVALDLDINFLNISDLKIEKIDSKRTKIKFNKKIKNSILKELLERDIEISSLVNQKTTLEEIIYKTSDKKSLE